MIYDTTIDLLKLLFNGLEFLKPYATIAGVLFLILRQNSIKKIINGHLPRRFRDTRDSDIQEIKQNIKDIKSHLGVASSNLLPNGQVTTKTPFYRRFFLLSQAVTILRRKKLMNKLKSRKFWMAIIAVVLPVINEQFNIGLDNSTVIAAIGGLVAFILGEAHIDSKKVVNQDVIPPTNTDSNK